MADTISTSKLEKLIEFQRSRMDAELELLIERLGHHRLALRWGFSPSTFSQEFDDLQKLTYRSGKIEAAVTLLEEAE